MHSRVKDMVVVITGSASGIGLNLARTYIRNAAKVVISDIDQDAIDKVVADEGKSNVLGVKCDVSKEEDCKDLISKTKDHFGKIDVLVNNAGLQHVANVEDFPTEKFEFMIRVMLIGAFLTIKNAIPIMKEQRFGRIINIASINGIIGFAGKAAYNSAKHGLIGLTKVVALECALHGITANAICPGYVDTPLVRGQLADLAKTRGLSVERVLDEVLLSIVPQKTLIDVNDIADLILFVSSPGAKNITGQNLIIDGGYTAQ